MERSYELNDFLKQNQIVTDAIDRLMNECGAIYPLAHHLLEARNECAEAIKWQCATDMGVAKEIEDTSNSAKTNFYWDWNKEFEEWRKSRPSGVLSHGRKEPNV